MKNSFTPITLMLISLFTIASTAFAGSSRQNTNLNGSQDESATSPLPNFSAAPTNIRLAEGIVALSQYQYTYDGETHSPNILIGNGEFVEGVDYTVSGTRSAKDAGTYTIIVQGTEGNEFSAEKHWTISQRDVTLSPEDKVKHIGSDDPALTYTMEGLVEGEKLYGVTISREEGEEIGEYKISVNVENVNSNYQTHISGDATFKIEAHQYVIGETYKLENVIPSTCVSDGSHDEVYYCQTASCGIECERIHVFEPAKGHDFYDHFTIDARATCENEGSQSRHCSRCMEKIEITTIPALGHNFGDGVITTEPTCTQKGQLTHYCTNYGCVETITEELDSLGHDFMDEFTIDIEPSCETEGQQSIHCNRCEVTVQTIVIPAKGHDWDEGYIKTKATCEKEGERIFSCNVDTCSATKSEIIEALGHDFMEDFITDTFPTCEKPGWKSQHCSRCKAITNATEIPPTGHIWGEGDTLRQPSCHINGEIIFHCIASDCEATKVEEIPALGHQWDGGIIEKEATCLSKGIITYTCTIDSCRMTNTEELAALGHNFNETFTIDMPATCTRSGKKSQHCSRCSATTNTVLVQATGHSWGNPTTKIASTCTTSGIVTYSCTHDGCQQTRTQVSEKLGHDFETVFKVDTEPTCAKNGSKSRHCSRCSEKIEQASIPALGHIAGDTIIDRHISETCTETGEISYVVFCERCMGELWRSNVTIPASGHEWNEGIFLIAPTTENMGKKVITCQKCGKTQTELIDKLYDDIVMKVFPDGSIFDVKLEGYCPGSDEGIAYEVMGGIPIDYKIEYGSIESAQGFENTDWTNVSADDRIIISVPENCKPGTYTADVYFRNEKSAVTKAYPISFRVNINSSYTVAIFEDVVSIDNRENLYSTFQWYHNDKKIEGATKAYYQEKGGLTGSYYVWVNMGTDTESRTCSRSSWDIFSFKEKNISVSSNPIKDEATIYLHNFEESTHTLSIINGNGANVITEDFTGDRQDINVSDLPAGNYIINVDGLSLKVIIE